MARAIWDSPRPIDAWDDAVRLGHVSVRRTRLGADAALSVLWPEVERLRAELAHARAVIARHVEPLRKPCRPEAGDCCDGDAHTWQPSESSRLPDRVDGNRPSDALCGDLTGEGCGSGVRGRVDETGGSE